MEDKYQLKRMETDEDAEEEPPVLYDKGALLQKMNRFYK
jgi:hypothetical protein